MEPLLAEQFYSIESIGMGSENLAQVQLGNCFQLPYITDVQYNVSISIDLASIDTERQAPYKMEELRCVQ
jgi:hypothetical protein